MGIWKILLRIPYVSNFFMLVKVRKILYAPSVFLYYSTYVLFDLASFFYTQSILIFITLIAEILFFCSSSAKSFSRVYD